VFSTANSLIGVVVLVAFAISLRGSHAGAEPSAEWKVASATEADGALHIVLRTGRRFTVQKATAQCSFEDIQIAPDGMTVGWTEGASAERGHDPPCMPGAQHVAAGPAVWRAGKIIRRLPEMGAMMDWSFNDGGRQIAVHAGPLHFDDELRVDLYDVASGIRLEAWGHSYKTRPPNWAAGIVSDLGGDDDNQ
jgi:hypothetical protein